MLCRDAKAFGITKRIEKVEVVPHDEGSRKM